MQTQQSRSKTSELVVTAMMMCIIMVAIFVFRIPIPFTQGYVNLSDGIIFISVFILGKKYATVAAALGSMLGDIIGGFPMWAVWTFFIKGGMALIVAIIFTALVRDETKNKKRMFIGAVAMSCGGIFMTFGYFISEGIMYGNWVVAALGIPWNIGQFTVGILLASGIKEALKKAGVKLVIE